MSRTTCWFQKVADEFERVAKDAETAAIASREKAARELATLATAIRQDCGCGDHAPGADHAHAEAPPARRKLP